MLRISQYFRELAEAERTGAWPALPPARGPAAPPVRW